MEPKIVKDTGSKQNNFNTFILSACLLLLTLAINKLNNLGNDVADIKSSISTMQLGIQNNKENIGKHDERLNLHTDHLAALAERLTKVETEIDQIKHP